MRGYYHQMNLNDLFSNNASVMGSFSHFLYVTGGKHTELFFVKKEKKKDVFSAYVKLCFTSKCFIMKN